MKHLAVFLAVACALMLAVSPARATETTHEKCSSDSLRLWFAYGWDPSKTMTTYDGEQVLFDATQSVVLAKGESAVLPGFIESSYGGGSPYAKVGDGDRASYENDFTFSGGSWLPWSCGGPSHDISRCGFGATAWRVKRSSDGSDFTVECAYSKEEAAAAFGWQGKLLKPAPGTQPGSQSQSTATMPAKLKALIPSMTSVPSVTGVMFDQAVVRGADGKDYLYLTVGTTAINPTGARFFLSTHDPMFADPPTVTKELTVLSQSNGLYRFKLPWPIGLGEHAIVPGNGIRISGLRVACFYVKDAKNNLHQMTASFVVPPKVVCGEGGCTDAKATRPTTSAPVVTPVPAVRH